MAIRAGISVKLGGPQPPLSQAVKETHTHTHTRTHLLSFAAPTNCPLLSFTPKGPMETHMYCTKRNLHRCGHASPFVLPWAFQPETPCFFVGLQNGYCEQLHWPPNPPPYPPPPRGVCACQPIRRFVASSGSQRRFRKSTKT